MSLLINLVRPVKGPVKLLPRFATGEGGVAVTAGG